MGNKINWSPRLKPGIKKTHTRFFFGDVGAGDIINALQFGIDKKIKILI